VKWNIDISLGSREPDQFLPSRAPGVLRLPLVVALPAHESHRLDRWFRRSGPLRSVRLTSSTVCALSDEKGPWWPAIEYWEDASASFNEEVLVANDIWHLLESSGDVKQPFRTAVNASDMELFRRVKERKNAGWVLTTDPLPGRYEEAVRELRRRGHEGVVKAKRLVPVLEAGPTAVARLVRVRFEPTRRLANPFFDKTARNDQAGATLFVTSTDVFHPPWRNRYPAATLNDRLSARPCRHRRLSRRAYLSHIVGCYGFPSDKRRRNRLMIEGATCGNQLQLQC
jgi:hypothetical protein